MTSIVNSPYRADGGDIGTDRIKEIANNPYGDEEKCWLAKRVLALLNELEAKDAGLQEYRNLELIYKSEFCHHDSAGEQQWHWEDVNKAFFDQYDSERRGKRRILYTALPVVLSETAEVARAALDYVDCIPADIAAALPAMPGFDRDWAENVLAAAKGA